MTEDVSAYFYGVKEDVSADYKDLASFLRIQDTRNIEGRNRDATSCCMDVLETWQRLMGDQATVEVLEQALISAGLQSAADNLRRERERRERDSGDGNFPTPTNNQQNIEVPAMVEKASSENGGFSCRITRNFCHFSYICCKPAVWIGFFYACLCVYVVSLSTSTLERWFIIAAPLLAMCLLLRVTSTSAFSMTDGMVLSVIMFVICRLLSAIEVICMIVFFAMAYIIEKWPRRTYGTVVYTSDPIQYQSTLDSLFYRLRTTAVAPPHEAPGRTNTLRRRNSYRQNALSEETTQGT